MAAEECAWFRATVSGSTPRRPGLSRRCRDRRALHQVAGIQQDAIVAVGALPPDHGCEVGESPVVIVERRQARVQIVGWRMVSDWVSAASNEPSSSDSASRRRV